MARVNQTGMKAAQGTEDTENPQEGTPKGSSKEDKEEGTHPNHHKRAQVMEAKPREYRSQQKHTKTQQRRQLKNITHRRATGTHPRTTWRTCTA